MCLIKLLTDWKQFDVGSTSTTTTSFKPVANCPLKVIFVSTTYPSQIFDWLRSAPQSSLPSLLWLFSHFCAHFIIVIIYSISLSASSSSSTFPWSLLQVLYSWYTISFMSRLRQNSLMVEALHSHPWKMSDEQTRFMIWSIWAFGEFSSCLK